MKVVYFMIPGKEEKPKNHNSLNLIKPPVNEMFICQVSLYGCVGSQDIRCKTYLA